MNHPEFDHNTEPATMPTHLAFAQVASIHQLPLEEARSHCLMLMALLAAERERNHEAVQTITTQAIDLKNALQALSDRAETIANLERQIGCLETQVQELQRGGDRERT
jgi:hypothetical protein